VKDEPEVEDHQSNDSESNESELTFSRSEQDEPDIDIDNEPSDQSVTQRTINEVEFEGSIDEFRIFFTTYAVTHRMASFPHRWIKSANPYAFITEKKDWDSKYIPLTLSASPLPNSRALLTFIIPTIFEEEYIPICRLLVEHLREIGWVLPKDNREYPKKKTRTIPKESVWKNKPRQDVFIPVSVALYSFEKGDCKTLTSAAKKFHTHTDTIKKYKEIPEVKELIEKFRKDEQIYGKMRQQANEINRRKKKSQ